MARMIPPFFDPDPKHCSPGEQDVFARLRDDPATAGWTVLHSLDIARHEKRISGEADFVVIVPAKGVVCLEVKGHSHISCEEGLWRYGSDPKPDPRGPFKQAEEATHSLIRKVKESSRALRGVVFDWGVVLPYVDFKTTSSEWHEWQVIDSRSFRANLLGKKVEAILDRRRESLMGASGAGWFDARKAEPTLQQCRDIGDRLRPTFEFFESPKARRERTEENIKHYTEEQFEAIDMLADNPRIIFDGPGGTGKTLLAIETTRRAVAAGRKVLFLCFNRLLARWLEEQVADLGSAVRVAPIYDLMLSVCGKESEIGNQDSVFWEKTLPSLAIDCLLGPTQDKYLFDELVVDETQDVLREPCLEFMDLCLKGGLASGCWRFFGDSANQSIYGGGPDDHEGLLRSRLHDRPTTCHLLENCRNTRKVASWASKIGMLEKPYRTIRRDDDGLDPEIHRYTTPDDQSKLLVSALDRLHDSGFSGSDLVVLSMRSDPDSAAAAVSTSPWKERLKPLRDHVKGATGYCSIKAFKGLEAPAIVVTDIGQGADDAPARHLLYVATTRAVHRLIILAHEDSKVARLL